MKLFLAELAIALAVTTVVAAVVFRSRRAWSLLFFLRRVGYVYVLVIVLAAAIRLWQG